MCHRILAILKCLQNSNVTPLGFDGTQLDEETMRFKNEKAMLTVDGYNFYEVLNFFDTLECIIPIGYLYFRKLCSPN